MFGFNLKVIAAAALAAFLMGAGGYTWGRLDGAALAKAEVEKALNKSRKDTDNAINELADEADRARMRRYLCERDRGGVWSFANNQCIETKAQP